MHYCNNVLRKGCNDKHVAVSRLLIRRLRPLAAGKVECNRILFEVALLTIERSQGLYWKTRYCRVSVAVFVLLVTCFTMLFIWWRYLEFRLWMHGCRDGNRLQHFAKNLATGNLAHEEKKKSVCLFQQQQLDKRSHIFINKTPIPLLTSKLISRNIQATTLL